jgi:hypothetical protein
MEGRKGRRKGGTNEMKEGTDKRKDSRKEERKEGRSTFQNFGRLWMTMVHVRETVTPAFGREEGGGAKVPQKRVVLQNDLAFGISKQTFLREYQNSKS